MLDLIISGRGNGKTLRLIQRSAMTHSVIVVSNSVRARYVAEMAHDLGYRIPYPVSIHDFNKRRGVHYNSVLVDDCKDVLESCFYTPVDALTFCPDDVIVSADFGSGNITVDWNCDYTNNPEYTGKF